MRIKHEDDRMKLRPETENDRAAVQDLTRAAFESSELGHHGEADLVDTLRAACPGHLALVAEIDGEIAGHILFTPLRIGDDEKAPIGMGLAPMSVAPSRQGEGIGSALVRRGLEILDDRDVPFVVVLGHGDYYPRFGFEPASRHGVSCEFDGVPDELFMIRITDAERTPKGMAFYHRAFHGET